MDEQATPLPQLFKEYFGGWVKDILEIKDDIEKDVIQVCMANGTVYRFGRKNGVIFLETIKKEEKA